MGWSKNGTPFTVSSPGDVMSVVDAEQRNFNQMLTYSVITTNIGMSWNLNNDTGVSYSQVKRINSGAYVTTTNANDWRSESTSAVARVLFVVNTMIAVSGELTLAHEQSISAVTGAATAPDRSHYAYKSTVNSPIAIVENTNINGSGSYQIGSNLSILGTD